MILAALILALAALALLLAVFHRISRNIGPLDLEDYARRNHVVFIPVSQQLANELQDWSKPVRLKLDTHRHPLLAELIVNTETDEA
jgi:hypothetical protein